MTDQDLIRYQLCWLQDQPGAQGTACDRIHGHRGVHSWELSELLPVEVEVDPREVRIHALDAAARLFTSAATGVSEDVVIAAKQYMLETAAAFEAWIHAGAWSAGHAGG